LIDVIVSFFGKELSIEKVVKVKKPNSDGIKPKTGLE
jgi:hypothetical protein